MGLCLIIALFFCLYLCLWDSYFNKFKPQEEYIIEIISIKQSTDYSDRYIAKILSGKNKNLRVFVYVYEKYEFFYGDVLKVNGETKIPAQNRNGNDFNYSRYLKTKKIVGIVVANKVQILDKKVNMISKIYEVKAKCSDILMNNFEIEEAKILKAILLGEKHNIEEEILDIFSKSGLNHILAISGFHVSYIVLYIEKFLKKVVKSKHIRYWILIIFIFIYMIFTGSSPSSVRACIMAMMYYLAKIFLQERDFYTSFLLSLFIILILNPFNIFSMSMWFSFLGSLGIYLFANAIHKVMIKKFSIKYNKVLNAILEAILVSVSAQILIFPIMWKVFGTISLTFWVSNVLTFQIIAPILLLGYMSIIIFPLRSVIVWFESILLKVFLYMVLISSKIPFNRFFIIIPSNLILVTYYFLIFAFVVFYKKRKFTVLKCILNFQYFKNLLYRHKKFLKAICAILLIIAILSQITYYIPKELRINFLSVGQGDCTLIRTKYNKVILVDSGEGHSEKYDYGEKVVLPYLLRNHISKIDYLVISHFDSDHARWCVLYIRKYQSKKYNNRSASRKI